MKRIRSKLTYANVISTIALFLALSGGVALAASKIHSKNIAKGAVNTSKLQKGAVKTSKLHARAVTSGKLAVSAVRSNQIADGAVGSTEIANGAVGSAQIGRGAVNTPQIADGAVGSAQIGSGAVAPSNLQVPVFFPARPTGGSTVVPPTGSVNYPLADSSWSQKPGQLNVIFGVATATLAFDGGTPEGECIVSIQTGLNGRIESSGQIKTSSTKPVAIEANIGGLPELEPGGPTTRVLTAEISSNEECAVGSTIESTRFQVIDFG